MEFPLILNNSRRKKILYILKFLRFYNHEKHESFLCYAEISLTLTYTPLHSARGFIHTEIIACNGVFSNSQQFKTEEKFSTFSNS